MAVHTPEWDFYQTEIENEPASIALDVALGDVAPVEELPFMLWVSVKLMSPDENGFPTAEEAKTLAAMEDEINDVLHPLDAIQVGRIKAGGMQDLYFYAPTDEGFAEAILEVMKDYPDYLFATDVDDDPEWNEYLGNLYPDHYQFQSMQNRRVLDELAAGGDDPSKPRPVDHLIEFDTEHDRAAFIADAVKQGYTVLSENKEKSQESTVFNVNIVRDDTVERAHVDEYVWAVITLAEKYKGSYTGWGCEIAK